MVEAVPRLRQQLTEQTPQEMVEPVHGRRRPVVVDPDTQRLVAAAGGVGDAFVHARGSGRERAQPAAGSHPRRIEQGVGQHPRPDQVQPVDRRDQRVGELGRRDRQPPRRMGQRRQRQQTARRLLLPERPRRTVRTRRRPEPVQPVDQREPQRVGQERRQHHDLARSDALLDQPGDPCRHPVEHLRVIAVVGEAQHAVAAHRERAAPRAVRRPVLRRLQVPGEPALERRQRRVGLREAVHAHLAVAGVAQAQAVLRVGAQKTPVAGVVVTDHQGGGELAQPGKQQVVRHRGVFLHVVGDQVAMQPEQIAPRRLHAPEVAGEHLHLQREVQQPVLQTEAAKGGGAGLHIAVDALLHRFIPGSSPQPIADGEVVETDHSRLVEVVEHLAVDAVAIDLQRIEATVAQQRLHDARHVVLGGLHGQEDRLPLGLGEAGLPGDQRPEQLHHPLRQPPHGGHDDRRAGCQRRIAERLPVGPDEGPLRQQHQDRVGAHAGLKQTAQAMHRGGRLAGAGGAAHEQAAAERRIGDLTLQVDQRGVEAGLPGRVAPLPHEHRPILLWV